MRSAIQWAGLKFPLGLAIKPSKLVSFGDA
jgi:hypothetical protein